MIPLVTLASRVTMRREGADQNRTGESFRSPAGTKSLHTARFRPLRETLADFVTPAEDGIVTAGACS